LFSSDACFGGLDYGCFIKLLFGNDRNSFGVNEIRLANSIVRIPPERASLYRAVKISPGGERAEYMFEPVFVEIVSEEPVYGEADENGVRTIVEHRVNVEMRPTKLDFDEFVANVWIKGVHFGIDANAVRDVIRRGASSRMDFAIQLEPTESKDAEVVEESDTMRQDNAPLILPNGKADLRRAKNRFPQVAKNVTLLRKIPRALGKPGYRVTGEMIEARVPLDVDLSKLAGEGTRIDKTQSGELLVANMDGFLVLDEISGEIFVTTKIENKGGISAKSTGDITLSVDEFTEHGEVQEGRSVEGKHMTFLSDVFGTVKSQGGNIVIDKNLSGGHAQSVGGNVTVNGRVINSTVEAWNGTVQMEFAESSIIMGKSVVIERAVNCEIIAEDLQIGISEGCAIAGKTIRITSSNTRKNRETVICIALPDIAGFDRQITEVKNALAQNEHALQAKNRELAATQNDPGFVRYLAIAEKLRAGSIKFTPEQQAGWQKIANQYAPVVRGTDGLVKKCIALAEALKRLTHEREICGGGEYCKINEVSGDTIVRKVSSNQGLSALRNLPQQELKSKLQDFGAATDRIFSDHKGSVEWHYKIPAAPTA
jgi:hypothetical protein